MTKDFLDSIDIKLLIERNKDKNVFEIMNIIDDMTKEDWYILGNPDVFEGKVFKWMDKIKFIEYVKDRYNDAQVFAQLSYFITI